MQDGEVASSSVKKPVHRRWPLWAAICLGVIGAILISVAAFSSRSGPPQPSAAAFGSIEPTYTSSAAPTAPATSVSTRPTTPPASSKAPATKPKATPPAKAGSASKSPTPQTLDIQGPILPASQPVSMTIPSLGVSSALLSLGTNADGTMQVPSLTDPDSKAGWYDRSPTPGVLGPSIIVGHIDSAQFGPGVFYKLGDLKPGDTINVARKDGTVAVFRVDGVRSYPKDDFPTLTVYGNIDHAGLRLITCGGVFNNDSGHYLNNIVVFASMVSSHKA